MDCQLKTYYNVLELSIHGLQMLLSEEGFMDVFLPESEIPEIQTNNIW